MKLSLMKKYLLGLVIVLIILLFGLMFFPGTVRSLANFQVASVFFVDSVKASDLKQKYKKGDDKIKILVVPGHDQVSFGTIDGEVKEVDMNLELSQYLYQSLKSDPNIEVTLSQIKAGYNPEIKKYIDDKKDMILSFREFKKDIMDRLVGAGVITRESVVDHISASNDTVTTLYGINHWANKNDIDLVLHVHFNDYPGRRSDIVPRYEGFSMYLPERQYSNSKASWEVARHIGSNLKSKFKTSNHPLEGDTLIPEQELIAIGSFNTLDAAAVLVEYGYIYETNLARASVSRRSETLREMAKLTSVGVLDFLQSE